MKNKKMIIILGILLLIIIAILSFFLLRRNNVKKGLVDELYEMVNVGTGMETLFPIYASGKITEEAKLILSIKKFMNSESSYLEKVTTEMIDESAKKVFGNDVLLKHQNVSAVLKEFCKANYKEETKTYDILVGCGTNNKMHAYREIVSSKQKGNEIYLTEKTILTEQVYNGETMPSEVFVYSSLDKTEQIDHLEFNPTMENEYLKINMKDYIKKARSYEYIFEKSGDQYIFKKFREKK